MKFITLLALVSVSSATEAVYKYDNNEIKVNVKYDTSKPNYKGYYPNKKYAPRQVKTVTKWMTKEASTVYSTVTKCSKPDDIPTPIYTSTESKPDYPVPKPSQSVYKPQFPILYPSNPPTDPNHPKPSGTAHKPGYPEPSKSNPETNPKPTGSYPSTDLSEQTIEMLCRVNALRAEVGKKPYKVDQRLMTAAQKHSEDQAAHKKMSHTGSKIKYFFDRIKASGYSATTGSENVAWNQVNLAHVMDSWKKSKGHYKNIIGDYDCFGWGEKDKYYTQVFGKGSECTNQVIPQCKSYPPFNPEDIWKNMKYY